MKIRQLIKYRWHKIIAIVFCLIFVVFGGLVSAFEGPPNYVKNIEVTENNITPQSEASSKKLFSKIKTDLSSFDKEITLTASAASSLTSISNNLANGWVMFIDGILKGGESFVNNTKNFVVKTNTKTETKTTPVAVNTPSPKVTVDKEESIPVKQEVIVEKKILIPQTMVQRITETPHTTIINQVDESLINRILGLEKAVENNISFNLRQIIRTQDSINDNISDTSTSITESGTLNTPTLNNSTFSNFTSTGTSLFTHTPTLAHTFSSWPLGTSNIADSTIYINPSTATADSNLLGLAVSGIAKFIVDAEGDIYANNLILQGSTSSASSTIATLNVTDNTTLGDAPTDIITITGRIDSDILPLTDDTYALGSVANRWNSIRVGTADSSFAGSVGIGKTSPSTALDVAGTVTATSFSGDLTGNVTGNVSGNAGTVSTITGLAPDTATTQALQPNITSLGTLTGLTMGGDITMGSNNITMTGSLGSTGSRLTKGWFTDLEVTNAIVGNITGNSSTVTTNANLTGPITSIGNTTSVASQTGTGSTFVMNTSPTLVTPVLGTASGTSFRSRRYYFTFFSFYYCRYRRNI